LPSSQRDATKFRGAPARSLFRYPFITVTTSTYIMKYDIKEDDTR